MSRIKAKILGTLILVLALVALATLSKVTSYSVSQKYAVEAAKQLDPDHDTEAYKVQNTQTGVNTMMTTVKWAIAFLLVFTAVMIWIPRKAKKKANKKIGKVY